MVLQINAMKPLSCISLYILFQQESFIYCGPFKSDTFKHFLQLSLSTHVVFFSVVHSEMMGRDFTVQLFCGVGTLD
jgi:thioredoxin-related protein